jgi:signal transduction histidine kinase
MVPKTYDPALVVGSLLVAILACFTALTFITHVSAASRHRRAAWLATGALAMGVGIWGMHFIGMLALRLPVPMTYNGFEVFASVIVACGASWLALSVAAGNALSVRRLTLAGIVLGIAIGGMHYTGMAAVRLAGHVDYDPWRVGASIGVAMIAAFAALWIAFQFRNDQTRARRAPLLKWTAATVMGLAVAGMHYTAMSAAHIYESPPTHARRPGLSDRTLATLVGGVTIIILCAGGAAALMDRRRLIAIARVREAEALERARRERELQLENAVAERTAHLATALREMHAAESLVRQLSDASTDGIAITRDGVVLETNRAWRTMFGPDGEQGGTALVDVAVTEDQSLLSDLVSNPMDGASEIRCRGRNEEIFLGSVTIQVGSWHTEPAQILVIRDVSAIRRIERLKGELISTVSHELRTPLTCIRGALGLIEHEVQTDLPPALKHLVHIGRTNCDRLIRLINDLLDLDKINAGQLELHLKDLVLPDVVQTTLNELAPMAEEHGVRVIGESESDLPTVYGDRDRLTQVVTNLVSNAIKFSPRRSTIIVRATTDASTDDRLRVSVENPGDGIAPVDIARLFRPFHQVDSSDARARGGTGLGLAIAKAIVEQHGGTIGVESVPKVLTTFWFTLPLATPALVEHGASNTAYHFG